MAKATDGRGWYGLVPNRAAGSSGFGNDSRETGAPDWHLLEPDRALGRLDSSAEEGLSSTEARIRFERTGPNELAPPKRRGPVRLFFSQFESPLVLILIVAAALSLVLWIYFREARYPYDFIIIAAIVLLNAVLGFIQEHRAEQALEALKSLSAPEARVLREGRALSVPAREVVPGDILLVEAGDRISADARVLHAVGLSVDESLLTGESYAVEKIEETLEADLPTAERSNLLHAGTAVVSGRGRAVVVATGMQTELGGIAAIVSRVETVATPLQRDIAVLGRVLGLAVLAIAAIVTLVAVVLRGETTVEGLFSIVLFGVALAVAAIPEGLPAVVTVALALGVRRMAARKAIVRRLPAVESLGSTTIICTDKTGTITRNELEVVEAYAAGHRIAPLSHPETFEEGALREVLHAGSLCNNALELGEFADPTDLALLRMAEKAGLDPAALAARHPRLSEMPFSSERKRMTTVHRVGERIVAYTKGAPEVILALCRRIREGTGDEKLTPEALSRVEEAAAGFASEGLRVLAIAERALDETTTDVEAIEGDLTLLGLVAMMDPPREEVAPAIAACRKAGIRVVMMTGDHLATALSVARRIGLWEAGDTAWTGAEMSRLSDEELRERIPNVRVFARVDPAHKIQIVDALQAHGHTVAMTGDGVNDAPALKRADIGVAMGISGTDVAREASDMILTDDNFATIVAAIEEGRGIFDNIRRFVSFLLSTNSGEVLTLFFGVILATQLGLIENGAVLVPLLAIHILWINLVTDGAPALALGVEPRDPQVLARPPRPPQEPVITRDMWYGIALMGATMCLGTLALLAAFTPGGPLPASGGSVDYARTVAFTVLVLFQLLDALNWRTYPQSLFRVPLLGNRWLIAALASSLLLQIGILYWPSLAAAFRAAPLPVGDWIAIILVASTVLVAMETYKAFLRRNRGWDG